LVLNGTSHSIRDGVAMLARTRACTCRYVDEFIGFPQDAKRFAIGAIQ
jgi:hypothetical protein